MKHIYTGKVDLMTEGGTALRFVGVGSVPRVGLIAFGQPWAGGRNAVGVTDPF